MIPRGEPRAWPVAVVLSVLFAVLGSQPAIAAPQDGAPEASHRRGDHEAGRPAWPEFPTSTEVGESVSGETLETDIEADELAESQDPSRRQTPPAARPSPAATPPPQPRTIPQRTPAAQPISASPRFYRLASVPEMFGDFFGSGTITAAIAGPPGTATATLPTAGGARRFKIAENNKPFPQDRVFFMYNHFHNAIEAELTGSLLGAGPPPDDFSVDRYTFGFEKTFCDGTWSAELRVPFTGRYEAETTGFEVDGGKWGNLSVILKRLLYANECTALAGGMAIDIPTGSDVDVDLIPTADSFTLHNDAVHLMPYLGFMTVPDDRWFCQGFAQLDVPLNGNRVDSSPAIGSGRLDEQVLLFLDVAAGYWLIRDEGGRCLTGLAPIVELHHTTTLEDADSVSLVSGADTFDFSNAANRLDVLQLTAGLHAEFANGMNLRVGAAFPLRDDDDKLFDAEVQVSVNWRF